MRVTDTVQTAHCAVYVVVPLWRLRFQSGWALTYNYIFGHTGKTGPRNSGFTTAPWRGPKVQNSGESGLKGAGFEGGGKCGEIGHCNQAGRNPWLLPDHARQCWLGFTRSSKPKIQPNPKKQECLAMGGCFPRYPMLLECKESLW